MGTDLQVRRLEMICKGWIVAEHPQKGLVVFYQHEKDVDPRVLRSVGLQPTGVKGEYLGVRFELLTGVCDGDKSGACESRGTETVKEEGDAVCGGSGQ